MQKITSVCPYCGCGCKLDYVVENRKLVKVLPDAFDDVSEGKPCIKGLALHEVIGKGRILKPMVRKNKSSKPKEVSWEEALEFVYKKTKGLSPEEILFVPSGKITNEDNYVIQKFAANAFKTKNVDSCCSRLCHAVTARALEKTFGCCANPWKIDDVYNTDCLFVIGSNPASNHPVLFDKILKNKKKGMKIISVQPMGNLTSEHADLSLIVNPWSEAVLLGAMINHLIKTKNYDKRCESMEGFSELKEDVKNWLPKDACKSCGIKEKKFSELMEMIINSKSFGIIHGMGITQDENAMDNMHSLLNLLILKNGRLLSSRGEVNVQGASDVCREKEIGKNIVEALLLSPVKAAFVSGFNPAQSMPNLGKVHKNLKKMFLVQMDSYCNLTSEFADVVLPTPTIIERTGTITNGERRIRFVKKVINPLGEARPDWLIFKQLSKLFDLQFNYETEKDIFKEIVKNVPGYENIDVNAVYSGNDAWAKKEIKFYRFNSRKFKAMKDTRTKKYPFILVTFRSPYHFLTGEMTTKSKALNELSNRPYCYINEDDAKKLKLKDGNKAKITSCASSLEARVKVDKRFPKGIVGAHFHFKELLVNKLFPGNFEKETYTPDYKSIEVDIKKL